MYNEIFTAVIYFLVFLGLLRFIRFTLVVAFKLQAEYHKYRVSKITDIGEKLDYVEALAYRTLAQFEWIQKVLRYIPIFGTRLATRFDANIQLVQMALTTNEALRKVARTLNEVSQTPQATPVSFAELSTVH